MGWFRGRPAVPPRLRAVLGEDERLLGTAETAEGSVLGATRFGLWVLDGDGGVRFGWDRVATARLAGGRLTLVTVQSVDRWAGPAALEQVSTDPGRDARGDPGMDVVRDAPPVQLDLLQPTRLTDAVHTRVRRSVAASGHLDDPAGGGWVAWRRVPGRDGLQAQFRLDPGVDPGRPGLAAAAAELAAVLDPRG